MVASVIRRETMGAQLAAMIRAAILSGEFQPGEPVTEAALSLRFGASRGPIREAMRHLIDEGLLISVPYTGTRVIDLSAQDINDIYAMRICLEIFAFEQIWERRGEDFYETLKAAETRLLAAIDAGNDVEAIDAELDLHGVAYEYSGNGILLTSWRSIRGRLQLYWAAHHRAHGILGPRRESHDDYIALALGDDCDAMKEEIRSHMKRGFETTKSFVDALETAKDTSNRRVK